MRRFKILILAVNIAAAMTLASSAGATVTGDTSFTAPAFSFTPDTLGANDVPGQKDLTAHATTLTTDLFVAWKWDEISFSGGNTGDACALFDTDSNGNIDNALCVTIGGKPAVWQSTRVYTCGDSKNDRCTSTYSELSPIGSRCRVDDQASPTFSAGSGAFDTQATCKVAAADFPTTAVLVNTCSYPSREPTSAPSDCVLVPGVRQTGAIEITKTGADANCTGAGVPTANCQAAGVAFLGGAHFEITGTGVPAGAEDLVTSSAGKVCFAGLPTGNTYTVNEKTPPTGYQIDDTVLDTADPGTIGVQTAKLVQVNSAGTCSAGATAVGFTDSPLSSFEVIFTPPATGVTLSQIECSKGSTVVAADTENGAADTTGPPTRDDTDETYSGLTAGTYTCTIDINP